MRYTRTRSRLALRLYSLGVISGSLHSFNGPDGDTIRLYWTGRRPYVFGVTTRAWGCLLRRRHIRRELPDCASVCTICLPCPTCGNNEVDHRVDIDCRRLGTAEGESR